MIDYNDKNPHLLIKPGITGLSKQKFNSNDALNKVQDEYSSTIKLENKSTENLINKIYQELLIKLSQNILTR